MQNNAAETRRAMQSRARRFTNGSLSANNTPGGDNWGFRPAACEHEC